MPRRAYLNASSATSPTRRIGPLTPLTSIGRNVSCTVTLADDPHVSKLHAEVRQAADGRYVLEDRHSHNGTLIDGRDIVRHVLRPGDRFVVGGTTFEFELAPEEAIGSVWLPRPTALRRTGASAVASPDQTLVDVEALSATGPLDAFRPADAVSDAAELRRDYEKLRAAHAILAELSRPQPVDAMLEVLARRTFEALPATRFAVFLCDDAGELRCRLDRRRDGAATTDAVPVSRTILDRVRADAAPLLARDVPGLANVGGAPSIVAAAVRSVVCAPATEGGELFGLLYADVTSATAPFDERDLALLCAIAGQFATALRNARLVAQVREETRRRSVLGRFLSPNLVNEVLDGRVSLSRAGEPRTVAVLFTDIRGFTSLAERMTAGEVTALLNEHFDALVEVVFRHGGMLDKYIGDSVMAVFGAPKSDERDAESAVKCALEMQLAVERLDVDRTARGDPPVTIGVGVAHGEVSWGPIGARDTMDYTVVGDVVNVASRLCGAAKAGEVLVSGLCRARLPATFVVERHETTAVKGKAGLVEIWRVVAPASDPGRPGEAR